MDAVTQARDQRTRFEVLGPLRVRQGDEPLALGGPKPRALLGILLLHHGEPVGVEELTEALWEDEPPPSASVNLRAYVRTLRRALNPDGSGDGDGRVVTRPPGYLINVAPGELDLQEFRDLDATAREARERGEDATAARRWRQALDLWRGRPLADVRGGPRLNAAVVRLQERRLRVMEAWVDTQLALSGHAELVGELRGLVAADPLHEPFWTRLMVALHRTGRTADALAAYGQARARLVDELGVEPGQQLQRIQRAILAGDAVVAVDESPPDGRPPPRPVRVEERPPPLPADEERPPPPADDVSPYRGLMPFGTGDAEWFFGRERLVAELVTYLSSQILTVAGGPPSLLAVVAPSGAGKSSLLRAGLLPALDGGALPAVRDWPKVVLTPGARPLAALTEAVTGIRPGVTGPEPDLRSDPRAFARLVRGALGPQPSGRRVLLVVDQLEELFTLCKDERERQAFITALCAAAGAGDGPRTAAPADAAPAAVVLGLRADFYAHCIAYPELLPVLSGSQVVVGPMTEPELRLAVERPAARAGLTLETGLVNLLLSDVGLGPDGGRHPEPGFLPLLSHALLATWQRRDGHRLTVAGYRDAGGMQGAIATTAEAVHAGLTAREQTVARQLFTRLVALGEGTEDTRRRITHDELLDGRSEEEVETALSVLDALARARLIVLGANTIEVAHEALIQRWPRLREWLTEDRADLRTHRQLTEAAQAWDALGRDAGALYRGARLAVTRHWAERDGNRDDLNALEVAFLDASVASEAAEGMAWRRRATRLRQLAVAILVLVLLAAAGGVIAVRERQHGAEQERIARSQGLARAALDLPAARRSTAMLVAAEAYRTEPTLEAREALFRLSPEEGYVRTVFQPSGGVEALAFSPDGDLLAASGGDGTLWLHDFTGEASRVIGSYGNSAITARSLDFSPDGEVLAVGSSRGAIQFFDVASESPVASLRDAAGSEVTSLAFSPDGRLLASGMRKYGDDDSPDDGGLVLWDLEDEAPAATLLPAEHAVNSVAFSPDGRLLASGEESGDLIVWDVAARRQLATLTAGDARGGAPPAGAAPSPVRSLAFSPDGGILAVAQEVAGGGDEFGETPTVSLWDVRERALSAVLTVPGTGFSAQDVAFSPDGGALAAGSGSAAVMVWDVSAGPRDPVPTLYSKARGDAVAFSPDGRTLAAAGDLSTGIQLLDHSERQIVAEYEIDDLTYSEDRGYLLTSDSNRVDIWDAEARTHLAEFQPPGDPPVDGPFGGTVINPNGGAVFDPSGESVAWNYRGDVMVWRHAEGTSFVLEGLGPPGALTDSGLRVLGFSEDGTTLFGADTFYGALLVWNLEDRTRTDHEVPGLAYARIGAGGDRLVTTTRDGDVTLWDLPGLARPEVFTRLDLDRDVTVQATLSQDGSRLVTADGTEVVVWDVQERDRVASFSEISTPGGVGISPDNREVFFASRSSDVDQENDVRVIFWDVVDDVRWTALATDSLEHPALVSDFDSGGMTASFGPTVQYWDTDPERTIERICATLGPGLGQETWEEFLPDVPYRATCG